MLSLLCMLRKRAYIFSYKYGKFCTLEWQLSLVCASWQNTKRSSSKKPNCKFQQDALGDDEAQHQNCLSLCSLLRDDCSPLYDHGAWTVRENRFWNNTSEPLSPALRDKKKKKRTRMNPQQWSLWPWLATSGCYQLSCKNIDCKRNAK